MTSEADRAVNIALFASGGGSNALKIMEYFKGRDDVRVALVVANKPKAGVLEHAFKQGVPSSVLTKSQFNNSSTVIPLLDAFGIDFIVLAGFLLLVPEYLVDRYKGRMVNIHPALLPKYGGKGMYGMHVHRAVKEAGDLESGMTVHYVTPEYDKGAIIAQHSTPLSPEDTPEEIAAKVLKVEHQFYAPAIDKAISAMKSRSDS